MVKKVKQNNSNPYDILRQLSGATHTEVQYFLPYLTAWLEDGDDPMLADMMSVSIALLMYAVNGQLFVPGEKTYKH
tara:strand:+ start:811 stop:1038 length:228 start_codon:yes stop_codon:yes gene_type:complete